MEIKQLFARLHSSEAWKDTKKENKEIFFCAGFFILNFKQKIFEYSLDYRDDKNLFAFKIPGDESLIVVTKDVLLESPKPMNKVDEKQLPQVKTDIENLKEKVEQGMFENNIKAQLDEVIAVLQDLEGKIIWNLTCICAGFTILNIHIDPFSGKILKFDKKNLMDFASMKKVDKK